MSKARHTQPSAPIAAPAVESTTPAVDLEALRSAYAAAVDARTAAAAAKSARLRAFAQQRDAASAAALKAADVALQAAEADARLLGETLADAEAGQAEAQRLARLAATAELRQRAAEGARALAEPARRVDLCLDALRQAMSELHCAGGAVHEDVAHAIDGLGLSEDHTIDLRCLLLPRAAARGPAATTAFAGMVRSVVSGTDADLSEYIVVNQFGRTGGRLASAMLADAELIASRLGVTLQPLSAKTQKDAAQ
jgi:hypothetical protein